MVITSERFEGKNALKRFNQFIETGNVIKVYEISMCYEDKRTKEQLEKG